ncbi:Chromobox 8 [Liparis tanakae]|uniref:Chromobox 8 n=1 Tax=Liparis tanakae TaxID=230148 RepID=A0A4Z2EYL5_9TELE|nr:Chromobox 8 [Liparis tanakae]
MELSAVGERVFAAESIIKRRVRKVASRARRRTQALLPPPRELTGRYSTWEPEENILDSRLFVAFEERERERELYGPKKRGPKPKTFLLKAQAKLKAQSYEFRGVRGMHISYPTPEPAPPPRAREGLRAVVPTIFPPGAVNRGESVRGADGMRLLEVVRRHPEPHGHKRRHRHRRHLHHRHHLHLHHTHERGRLFSAHGGPRPHRTDTHRTKDGAAYLAPVHFKHRSKVNPGRRPRPPAAAAAAAAAAGPPPRTEKPYFLDRPSPTRLDGVDAAAWRPSAGAVETVLVTDVTTNFLTVTIKESSSSKGFFRDMKRAA